MYVFKCIYQSFNNRFSVTVSPFLCPFVLNPFALFQLHLWRYYLFHYADAGPPKRLFDLFVFFGARRGERESGEDNYSLIFVMSFIRHTQK